MTEDVDFLELIEIHERRWGSKGYPGRPTLKEIMESPIVAAWAESGTFMLSTYETADQINEAVTCLFTTAGPGARKLVKIFYKHQPMPFSLQIIRIKEDYPPQAPPKSAPRYTMVKEIQPVRYGHSVPARNDILPGRNGRLLKGRKTPRK